jgi:hypothetical protein
MKNSNDTIGNRTRDLPTCSAVSQPTAPPRAPNVRGTEIKMSQFHSFPPTRFHLEWARLEAGAPCLKAGIHVNLFKSSLSVSSISMPIGLTMLGKYSILWNYAKSFWENYKIFNHLNAELNPICHLLVQV